MGEQQNEIDRLLGERQKLMELQRQLGQVYNRMPTANSQVCLSVRLSIVTN